MTDVGVASGESQILMSIPRSGGQVYFNWDEIRKCAARAVPAPPNQPGADDGAEAFVKHYDAERMWGYEAMQIQQCQIMLAAYQAGIDSTKEKK